LPIQFSPEWMDAVCIKGDWGVVVSQDVDKNLEGVLVYHIRKYRGFTFILMPPLTFYNGIYLNYRDNIKNHSKLTYENEIIEKLITQLPKHDLYYQQYSPQITNWNNLYWKEYSQSTRYSYIIDKSIGEDKLWEGLKGNVRRNIKKAEKLCRVETVDFDTFWKSCSLSFSERGKTPPFNKEVLQRLCAAMSSNGAGKIAVCRHKETNEILAGNFTVSDKKTTYYVCGYYNPKGKEIGGLSYLLWETILKMPTQFFDFEGSMIKDIEYFFRAFGGELTPHYKVWKVHNPLLKFLLKFKKVDFLS